MMRIGKLVKQFSSWSVYIVPMLGHKRDIYQLDTVRSSSPPQLRIATLVNRGGKNKLYNNINCKRVFYILFSDTLNPDIVRLTNRWP